MMKVTPQGLLVLLGDCALFEPMPPRSVSEEARCLLFRLARVIIVERIVFP